MLVKIKVDGFITLDVPYSVDTDEDVKQEWLNKFSTWVKDTQDELTLVEYDSAETYIEDLDFLVVD